MNIIFYKLYQNWINKIFFLKVDFGTIDFKRQKNKGKPLMFKYMLVFIFLLQSTVFATKQISLQEAINIGLENSNEEKISQLDRKIAWQQYQQAMSALYPQLKFQAGVSARNKAPTVDVNSKINISQIALPLQNALQLPQGAVPSELDYKASIQVAGKKIFQSSVEVQYPLYTGGKISSLIKQAKLASQIEELKTINNTKDLKWRIVQAYVQAWWSGKMKKVANDTYERMNFTYDLTKHLMDNGSTRVKMTDLLRTRSLLATIHSIKEELEAANAISIEYLNFVINSKEQVLPLEEFEFNKEAKKMMNVSGESATKNSPKLQMAKLATKVYEAKSDEARSGYLPSVLLYAKGLHVRDDYEHGYFNKHNKNSAEVGAGVEWKIFDGFLTSAKSQEARLKVQQAKLKEDFAKKGLAFEYRQAKILLASKDRKLKQLQDAYKFAKENRELNQGAYRQELVETKEMIESQVLESLAHGSFIDGQKELFMQQATLEKLTWETK